MSRPKPRPVAAVPALALLAVLLLGSCTSEGQAQGSSPTTITESELSATTGRATTTATTGTTTATGGGGATTAPAPGPTTTDLPTSHLCRVFPPADAGRILALVDVQDIGMSSQVEDEDGACRYAGRGGVELDLALLDLTAGPAGGYDDVDDYLARRRAEGGAVEEVPIDGADAAFLEAAGRTLAAVRGTRVFTFAVGLDAGSPYVKPGTGDAEVEAMLRQAMAAVLGRA